MNFIKENFEMIMIIFIMIMLVLSLVLTIVIISLKNYLKNRKFNINAYTKIHPDSKVESFVIQVHNQNINDVRLSGIGFLYQNQNIDYYEQYLFKNHFSKDYKLSIISREHITLEISVEEFKNLIYDLNKGSYKVTHLKVYIIDSLGIQTNIKAKTIRNKVKKQFKLDREAVKVEIKQQKEKIKQEKKFIKETLKLEKGNWFKITYIKIENKIKNIFKK